MQYRIYGWGSNPAKTLPKLKSLGFSSVTGGYSTDVAAICKDCGLDYYVSAAGFAAPTYDYTCADGETLPEEVCPLDETMRQTHLASMRTLAQSEGITGITIDFCRYPSIVEENKHFFGCFCETCMQKMTAAGYDAENIRESVLSLYRAAADGTVFSGDCDALADWIRWKQETITAYFGLLRDAVKETNPQLRFGAFTFAPSIAPLVGQDYAALDAIADYLSPMLYRHWRHEEGDACLDREACGLAAMAERNPSIGRALAACGYDTARFPGSAYLTQQGVTVAHMIAETEQARSMVKRAALEPIYLLEDPHIAYTIDCVRHTCDTVDFFAYRDNQKINVILR